MLARSCPPDPHPRVSGAGRCAQKRFANAPVLMAPIDLTPAFDLTVRRSFAE
jgi:sarcosine oxidase gamma subunit